MHFGGGDNLILGVDTHLKRRYTVIHGMWNEMEHGINKINLHIYSYVQHSQADGFF